MTNWRPGPLKYWLQLNDSGLWGDDPAGWDDVLVIRSTDIRLDGTWSLENVAERSVPIAERTAKRLCLGDLVVVKSSGSADHLGKTAIVDSRTAALRPCFANFVQRLRPTSSADSRYLWYVLNSRQVATEMEILGSTTTGLRNLNGNVIGSIKFPGPPLGTQRCIAEFLDVETARIDDLIVKKQRLGAAITARILASIESAVWSSEYNCAQLRRVCRFIDYRGATPSKSNSGVSLITASHIRDGWLDLETEPQWVDEATYRGWMRRGWPAVGDVLLTTEAPLGNVAQITESRVALAQRVILLKPNKCVILADFLALVLRSPSFRNALLAHATGSTALGIKADRLKMLKVPVLPLSQQQAKVGEIIRQEAVAGRVRRALTAQITLLRQRKQALITAAVTGEMNVPGAST